MKKKQKKHYAEKIKWKVAEEQLKAEIWVWEALSAERADKRERKDKKKKEEMEYKTEKKEKKT